MDKFMGYGIAFSMLIIMSFMTSFALEFYEKRYGELDSRLKPFILIVLGLLYGIILRFIYLSG